MKDILKMFLGFLVLGTTCLGIYGIGFLFTLFLPSWTFGFTSVTVFTTLIIGVFASVVLFVSLIIFALICWVAYLIGCAIIDEPEEDEEDDYWLLG